MPLMSEIERKSKKGRFLIITIYSLLVLGGISMVYPFLLMLGTSVTSNVDNENFTVMPAYIYNDTALYRKYLAERYDNDIDYYNYCHGTQLADFNDAEIGTFSKGSFRKAGDWLDFFNQVLKKNTKLLRPYYRRYRLKTQLRYNNWLAGKYGSKEKINLAYGENEEHLGNYQFPFDEPLQRVPFVQDSLKEKEWQEFKKDLPPAMLHMPAGYVKFRRFLLEKFNDLKDINKKLGTDFKNINCIFAVSDQSNPKLQKTIENFRKNTWPLKLASSNGKIFLPESLWHNWLREKYANKLDNLNTSHESHYASFAKVAVPYSSIDRYVFKNEKWTWRGDFLVGNYRIVWWYLAKHGRAAVNTVILVICTILLQLTINPLCAYALSRFGIRNAYAILLFCLATMSFPAEVAMIPNFVLLRDLGLLNTFWALILPGAANGFFIFLLKGFFDSLPKELFEAAALDGAGPMLIFYKLVLPLCKPILAVIALQGFVFAYGSFMWAYIVCPDSKLWTIMVFLQQFQIGNPVHLVMASLVLASLPTLIIFLLCQRVILRGIVVPSMK